MTKKKYSNKKYKIDSFDRLLNVVNIENCERVAVDLAQWVVFYATTIKTIRDKCPKETKNKKNTQISRASFEWIDDGKNDFKGVTIEAKDTGEIKEIKL